VRLRLRMHLRVAVDLARRRDQEAGALELRETERVVRAVRADLQRVQRQPQVVDRARRTREVVDDIDRPLDLEVLGDVVVDEEELVGAEVLDVLQRGRLEVVYAEDPIALAEEEVAEVRSEEACPSGYDRGRHGARILGAPAELARLTKSKRRVGTVVAVL